MITCTLNGKKYTVDFITGRALREMEPAAKMYSRIVCFFICSLTSAALLKYSLCLFWFILS